MFPTPYTFIVECGPDSSDWISPDDGLTKIRYV